ncbi:hypothetical protein [Chryseosolibacter indicus]|uniref:Uncharacterized protein n=1 Tax=Chryseosolibacter indicus TaxID=2782351 RepID=A0ABS5VVZ0_9BACT|nr:hypothetical protein [Chryseosolibacter indicus]MBT1705600.1 hypothetical protein [Chryseosolibacter indicus]
MKNSKVTWLIILVIGVWGTIGFKIYRSLNSDEQILTPTLPKKMTQVTTKENYPLLLNYNDPFLKKNQLKKASEIQLKTIAVSRSVKREDQNRNVIITWDKIVYMGLMHNASKNIVVASLKIDGNDYIGQQGQLVNGFKIESIFKDSLQLSFGNQFKFIKKQ